MVIITKGAIHAFVAEHPGAAAPLNDWYHKTGIASWKNFQQVKATFNAVDYIGHDRYVFDVGGNNYRLIAMIHFSIRTVYMRAVLTHKAYDILSKAGRLQTL